MPHFRVELHGVPIADVTIGESVFDTLSTDNQVSYKLALNAWFKQAKAWFPVHFETLTQEQFDALFQGKQVYLDDYYFLQIDPVLSENVVLFKYLFEVTES